MPVKPVYREMAIWLSSAHISRFNLKVEYLLKVRRSEKSIIENVFISNKCKATQYLLTAQNSW